MTLEVIIVGVAIFANCGVGLLVLKQNPSSSTTRFFFLLSLALTSWILATHFSLNVESLAARLFWTRAVMCTAAAQVLFFYLLSCTFPDQHLPIRSLKYYLILGWGIIVGIVTLSPFLFTELVLKADGSYSPTPGPGFVVFLPFALGLLGSGLWVLIKKYRHARGIRAGQLSLLLAGVAIMFLLIIVFNLFLPLAAGYSMGVAFSPLFTVIFVGFTAYAIITKHLFDVRIFISRAIIYSALLGAVMAIYGISIYVITLLLGAQESNSSLIASLITAIALSYSFDPLRQWIAERTDSWLFKKEYEQQEVTKELSERLSNAMGLDEGLDTVMHSLSDTFHLNHAVTYVFQKGDLGKNIVKRSRQIGYSKPGNLELNERDFMVSYFTTHPELVLLDSMEDQVMREELLLHNGKMLKGSDLRDHAIRKVIVQKLKELDVAVAIPLYLKGEGSTPGAV